MTIPVKNEAVRWRVISDVICVILVSAATLTFTGCKKNQPTEQPTLPVNETTSQTASNPTAAPAPQFHPPTTTANLTQANGEPDLGELNRTLIRWIVAHKRPPANFEDFAATAGVQIPPPPAGKKYVIGKDMHVQVVNR